MENKQLDIYNIATIEFITVANEYCGFIELEKNFSKKDFVDKATKLLPLLYLKTTLLPSFKAKLDEEPELFVSEYDYNYISNNIAEKLEDKNDYLEVFNDDIQFSDSPIISYISENLADIYQDLKDTLNNYELASEEVMNDALLRCQSNFKDYWGQQLVNGLRALHQLNYNQELDEE